jgi:hypothetical protein
VLWVAGIPVKKPEYVPANDPLPIVSWLAEQKAIGQPAVLHTHSSSAVRICAVANETGIDIAGTTMIVSGEPFTSAKASVVASAGVTSWPKYAAVEAGYIGTACLAPQEVDELHVRTDNLSIIQRPGRGGGDGLGLFLTGVRTIFPKVMLNMEIGDYATLSQRDCGCPSQQIGLTTHLSGVRSYEKLTTEGVTYLGGDLVTLLEESLPQRFGGQPGDYQLVEEEEDGTTRISIFVSPSVGEVNEAAVVDAVLAALASESFGDRRRTGELWRGANVLRVVRREPLWTGKAKMLVLHTLGITQLQAGARGSAPTPPT